MPLSVSQRNYNTRELEGYLTRYPIVFQAMGNKTAAEVKQEILAEVWAACDSLDIVINTDVTLGMSNLYQLLSAAAQNFKVDELKKQLNDWVINYQEWEKLASNAARQLAAGQPHGIVRGLREQNRLLPNVWCEDHDVKECLKHVMLPSAGSVSKGGVYVFPPIALAGAGSEESLQPVLEELIHGRKFHLRLIASDAPRPNNLAENFIVLQKVENKLMAYKHGQEKAQEIDLSADQQKALVFPVTGSKEGINIQHGENKALCDTIAAQLDYVLKVPGAITALIPANDGGMHWRLASVVIQDNVIKKAELWDSMAYLNKQTDVYVNMQKNIDKLVNGVEVGVEAAGIQNNGWSCGDFVIQRCLQELPDDENAQTKTIRWVSAKKPELLRQGIVQQIVINNPELKKVVDLGPASQTEQYRYQIEFEKLFEEALMNARNFENAPQNTEIDAKKEFVASIKRLSEQTRREFYEGDLSSEESSIIARGARDLTLAVAKNTDAEITKGVEAFVAATNRFKTTWGWRMILGAVVGAVVGILLGAVIGAAAGPGAALTALALGVKGAIIGASLFGTGSLLAVGGIGLWGDRKVGEQEPLTLALKDTAAKAQQFPVKVLQ